MFIYDIWIGDCCVFPDASGAFTMLHSPAYLSTPLQPIFVPEIQNVHIGGALKRCEDDKTWNDESDIELRYT